MKKKSPSNVFTIPKWMTSLRIQEPEGTKTPDQVATSLELNLQWNDNCVEKLRNCIKLQVPLVPLKHQKVLKAFLAMKSQDLLPAVQAFINKANNMVAQLKVEEIEPTRQTLPAEPSGESYDDQVQLPRDWGSDSWDRPDRSKPRSRGQRALRAAKRGQAEA